MTRVPTELVPRFQSLERALATLGHYSGPIDDDWGVGVDLGIERLYLRQPAPAASTTVTTSSTAVDPALLAPLQRFAPAYAWLASVQGMPRMIATAIRLLGTLEAAGAANSPTIMRWRDELRAAGVAVADYTADAVPWCGLFASKIALDAGYRADIPTHPLWALNWGEFGQPSSQPCLGDILTFQRDGGGHVSFYVGEDSAGYYHILGGNQSDRVSITRIAKSRMKSARHPAYHVRPAGARPFILAATGAVSHNEA